MTDAPSRAGIAIRLSALYIAMYGGVGIMAPFWPVWLQSRGLGAQEIGLVMAVMFSAKVVAAPLAAQIADRLGERRRPMIVMALCGTALFALFPLTGGFWSIILVTALYASAWAGINPLAENIAMISTRRAGLDYGRIRLWGSLAFVATAIGAGRVLDDRPDDVIYWMLLGTVALSALACAAMPDVRTPATHHKVPAGVLLKNPVFVTFLAGASFIQASNSLYYAFGTLHWRAAGHSDLTIGLLWSEGVIAEVVLFIVGAFVLARVGVARLIIASGALGLLRWGVTAETTALVPLIAVQTLHAATFGAVHLATINFIARAVPPSLSASAQALYGASAFGVGTGLAMAASGPAYAAFGGSAFWAMAGLAAIGSLFGWRLHRIWADGAPIIDATSSLDTDKEQDQASA